MRLAVLGGVGGVAVLAAYLYATRPRWRVVRGASAVPWARLLPDTPARWVADAARVVVLVESIESPGDPHAWIVQVERATGPDAVRGRFVGPVPGVVPAAWSPKVGASVELGTSDALGLA